MTLPRNTIGNSSAIILIRSVSIFDGFTIEVQTEGPIDNKRSITKPLVLIYVDHMLG